MIALKSKNEIELMRRAGRIAAECIEQIKVQIAAGNTPLEIDQFAEKYILKHGAIPSFKGYMGFPATICVSVNEEVVHGIPTPRPFREGDLVSVDIGAIYEGFHADMAVTVGVGKLSPEHRKLIEVTRESLFKGIEQARVGNQVSDISHAVQKHVEKHGFSVVRELVGHGVGRRLHEEPQVPNYGKPKEGPVLEAGMVIAIEPMVNLGKAEVRVKPDKWTVATADLTPSAHFEHTVAVTPEGPLILTVPYV